jgi:hypothetical protein
VSKWNPLALKLLMWVMGALLVMGSGLGFIGSSFFRGQALPPLWRA